jgi:hypothetical protein
LWSLGETPKEFSIRIHMSGRIHELLLHLPFT